LRVGLVRLGPVRLGLGFNFIVLQFLVWHTSTQSPQDGT
jgi:hypothetical protein